MKFVSFVPKCDFYKCSDTFKAFTQDYSVGVLHNERVYALSTLIEHKNASIFSDMSAFIINHTPDMLKRIESAIESQKGLDINEVSLLSPIPEPRQDVICLGINYIDHAKESALFKGESFEKRDFAIYFSKRANYATPNNAPVPSHSNLTNKLDYEAELGVVLGKTLHKPKNKQAAMEAIFGYTIINDISSRDIQQRHKQWYMGKSLDGCLAMGPYIVSGIDSSNLSIKTYVNGELRQDSNTSLMIFDIASALYELSHYCILKAGSIISTGTPSGVGMGLNPPTFLKSGDEVVCVISNIGALKNRIV